MKTPPNDQPLLSLADLAKALPSPDLTTLAALTDDDEARAELALRGREIASSKLVIDEQRIYNQAYQFYAHASVDQKKLLRGFTLGLLALAVSQAQKDQSMAAQVEAARQHASVAASGAQADAARAHGNAAALREQGVSVLKSVAAHKKTWLARIDAAHANADVATALGELAALGQTMLADKKDGAAKRAALFGLDTDFLGEMRDAANAVATVDVAHVGRVRGGADQAALDLEDGINLHLLAAIVAAFEHAHDRDERIPRLVPIATRRLIGAHSHGARDAKAPPTGPGPAPAAPATPATS